jgi:LCP family protein required for cell wall assembly
MAAKETQLRQQNSGLTQNQLAFQGNEAGRAATVATVEQLTGVHIDHFAEVNLDGFYELANVLGGVEVCLNKPVPYDPNSGFSAAKAGYQHLNAKQALAFVRQRDGLTNGDLDRTHRQQAFLDSVIQQLHTDGVLSDLTKVEALLSVAKQYVITDSGWDLLNFAAQMRGLTSGDLSFRTLPITGYETIAGQAANAVDPAQIQQIVKETFDAAPSAASSASASAKSVTGDSNVTTDVFNGGGTQGLAGQVSTALASDGFKAGQVGNTSALSKTEVLYGTGTASSASKIASLFGVTATASSSVAVGHVEVLLGVGATVPSGSSTGTGSTAAAPSASSSASASASNGPAGGVVNAANGIPCVN